MATPDQELRPLVEAAFRDRALLQGAAHREAVLSTLALLDRGALRVASRVAQAGERPGALSEAGAWQTHAWVKEAILLYFALRGMERMEVGPFEFHDKIPLKHGLD